LSAEIICEIYVFLRMLPQYKTNYTIRRLDSTPAIKLVASQNTNTLFGEITGLDRHSDQVMGSVFTGYEFIQRFLTLTKVI